LRKEVAILRKQVEANLDGKPPKTMKAALDTSTNYDKMIENAKKVLQQAERDKNVLSKRVAK
jgi:hypothetical protein